jgi:hypothetical protein
MRQIGSVDLLIAATLEEPRRARECKDRFDLELSGHFPARIDQPPAKPQALNVLRNRQTPDLRQIRPKHMKRSAANNTILIVDSDDKLLNRLVQLGHRPANHQPLICEDMDKLLNAGNVTRAGGAYRQ